MGTVTSYIGQKHSSFAMYNYQKATLSEALGNFGLVLIGRLKFNRNTDDVWNSWQFWYKQGDHDQISTSY